MISKPATRPSRRRTECGDLGISIDRNGVWRHRGAPFARMELVKLFSSVLSRDEDGVYWMTTPAERGTVSVEDVPFIAVEMTRKAAPEPTLTFRTNVDAEVTLDRDHPLRIEEDGRSGGPAPYIMVGRGLEARLARSVYYDLALLAMEETPPQGAPDGQIGVWSRGRWFPIGDVDDDAGAKEMT